MWLLLVLSDRPGIAGKTIMLTYIQMNAAIICEKPPEIHSESPS
jgi:hypothetical protein